MQDPTFTDTVSTEPGPGPGPEPGPEGARFNAGTEPPRSTAPDAPEVPAIFQGSTIGDAIASVPEDIPFAVSGAPPSGPASPVPAAPPDPVTPASLVALYNAGSDLADKLHTFLVALATVIGTRGGQ